MKKLILFLLLTACATDTRSGRLTNVFLSHLAKDAFRIAADALMHEAESGFSGDIAYNLQTSAREELGSIVSSDTLRDYLEAWRTPVTDAMARRVPDGMSPAAARQFLLVAVDSSAASVPTVSEGMP